MTPFIISLAIRLTILLLAGGLVAVAVRHSTYAVRHVVIAATLACIVALPAVMAMVPEWRVKVLPSAPSIDAIVTSAPANIEPRAAAAPARATIHPILVTSQNETAAPASATTNAPSLADRARALSAPQIVLAVWLVGVLFGLAWIAAGRLGLARVRREATPLRSYEWRTILEAEAMHAGVARRVELFTSPAVSMPVTWGVLSPVIVLPEASLSWTHDRKRVVVMHEMAHIARRDSATQLVATFACVAYWLHPLVLLAARRLRAECERACDERVLERGTPAAEYAAHLLDVARFSRSFGAASIVSVAMARPSQLEGRLLAVLRAEPRPARTSARVRASAAIFAALMLMAISAFRPVARETRAPVTTVRTALPAAIVSSVPRVQVTATSAPTARTLNFALVAPAVAVGELSAARAPLAPLPAVAVLPRADSIFQKSVPAQDDGTLELDLDTGGDVEIIGSGDAKVSVDGSLGGRSWRETDIQLQGSGSNARLASHYTGSSSTQIFNNTFRIRVPKKYNVRLTSSGGNVSISGVEGRFFGTTAGGKIDIDHAKGEANLSTGGGDVHVSNSHLDGSVATGGGQVSFQEVTGTLMGGSGSSGRRANGFAFSWPAFEKIPMMVDIDGAEMERSQREMAREQAEMARDGAEMERDQSKMYDSSMREPERAMMRSREKMERLRETMDRNRGVMDSARIMIDRNRGAMDSATIVLRQLGPMKYKINSLKYDLGGLKYDMSGAEAAQEAVARSLDGIPRVNNKMIVIDEDGGPMHRSGAVTVSAGKGEAHSVDVESGSGNIDVMLPEGANVTLDLESAYTQDFGRQTEIKGDWPLESSVTPDWDSTHGTPRKYVRVKQKIGKGGPLIRVRTTNGDIRLREES